MELNRNALALFILVFIVLSATANLFVWLRVSGYSPLGKVTQGVVGICIDQPPTLQTIGNKSVYVGEPFLYQVNATNPVSNPVYYYYNITNVSTASNFSSFNMSNTTGLINFTAAAGDEGNYSIYFWVTHDLCGTSANDSETIGFVVYPFNYAPIWINYTRTFTRLEDTGFYINLSAFVEDPDGNPMNFSHNSTPIIFPSFNFTEADGVIDFTVNDSDVGTHYINISVEDSRNATNSSVFTFIVQNVNDAPLLEAMPDNETCEDAAFYYQVNATDQDFQIPNTWEALYYSDTTDLFVINENTGVISFTPGSSDVGLHSIKIWVSDEDAADSKILSLDIIEVNDAPVLQTIGAKTIYTNDSFNYTAYASDEEDGDTPSTLRFNLSFISGTKFFGINPVTGLINFTANITLLGAYSVKVWVNDTALASPHANATSACNDGTAKSDFEIFSFTITGENRAPNITYYFPIENQTIEETASITFNVTAEDLDGTTTTIYWIQNNVTVQATNALSDTYTFTTDYDSAGLYNLTANVSDGELSDSITWNINVTDKTPPSAPSAAGGGGGGGGICTELWVCTDWSACQNATTQESAIILGDQYEKIIANCSARYIPIGNCGFQTRICNDKNNCKTARSKPTELQVCHYTLAPSCDDGIRNCHGTFNLCEVLVDCGGPCPDCPTCSDGIKNQGEEWTDCGGPCLPCPVEYPKPAKCGDKICHISEIATCRNDCGLLQTTSIVLVLLLSVLAILTRKEVRRKIIVGKESELKKQRKYINNAMQLARKAIASKDITLARHYYNITKKAYEMLPTNEKKRIYSRITKLFSDINNLK